MISSNFVHHALVQIGSRQKLPMQPGTNPDTLGDYNRAQPTVINSFCSMLDVEISCDDLSQMLSTRQFNTESRDWLPYVCRYAEISFSGMEFPCSETAELRWQIIE